VYLSVLYVAFGGISAIIQMLKRVLTRPLKDLNQDPQKFQYF